MRFQDNVAMAFKDLGRRKKRTFFTSLGITIGSILILLMVSLGLMLNQFLVSTINSGSNTKLITVSAMKADAVMPTNPKEAMSEMPKWLKENFKKINENAVNEISKINGVEGVKASIGATVVEVKYDNGTHYGTFPINGYDLNDNIYFNSDVNSAKSNANNPNFTPIIAGNTLTKENKNEVLVGEALLNQLGVTDANNIVGKNITIVIDNINGTPVKPYSKTFKVAGVMSKYMPDGNKIVMDSENAAAIAGFLQYTSNFMNTYGYNTVSVEANNVKDVTAITNQIKSLGYMATSNEETANQINSSFSNITLVLSILGIIVLIVAAIGIVNTMVMAVNERTKSIGVMKSVGASNSEIKSMFIVQAGAIGLVGGIIGSIVSMIIFRLITMGVYESLLKQGKAVALMKYIPWWLVLITIVFSIVISVLAGVYPASKASKLNPIDALRQ
ncbi:MAG: ABC transporter permease [Sarcina sp.]